ncbi:hypothetical protein ACROYT_G035860 [Oculina patagonica]
MSTKTDPSRKLLASNKVSAAVKGWAMSPVQKSVNANPLRRIWNGVLANVFFQIAAKISAFPVTATGDKTAKTIAVASLKVNHAELLVQSAMAEFCEGEDVVLLNMSSNHRKTVRTAQ